jgi:hypothetical protein
MPFKQLAAMRPTDANRIVETDLAAAEQRRRPIRTSARWSSKRSVTETFDIVHEAVKRMGWTIVANEGSTGISQASSRQPIAP